MDESDTTYKGSLNTSLDRSNSLEEKEIANTGMDKKNKVKISPLVVSSHTHPADGECCNHPASVVVERGLRRGDTVEMMVKEGKVVFIKHDEKIREMDAK